MTHTNSVLYLAAGFVSAALLTPVALGAQAPGAGAPAAPSRAAAKDPPSQAQMDADYRLEPGDKLRIDVYKDDHLSQTVQVRPDGKITMPLVGDLTAGGLTPLALRDRISTALTEYVNQPIVTVVVVEASAPTAYVVGEVNRPGAVVVRGDMTVLQALALAGGLKDFANAKNIRILRKGSAGMETLGFNYKNAIKGEGTPVYLLPGDTVVVPD